MRFVSALSFSALLISCGGSPATPPEAPPAPSGAPSAEPASTGEPAASAPPAASAAPAAGGGAPGWKDMKHEQRMEFMKTTVLPKMKDEFGAADAKRFGSMNCKTCHGDGMKDGSFKMPNPKLPKLSVEGGFKKHMDKSPEITKFMMQKVVPDMASLLGQQPYDPKTQQGFGCFACHVKE